MTTSRKPRARRRTPRPTGEQPTGEQQFTFRLRADDDVARVSFGDSPRVSLAAGDSFSTTDARLAQRLRRHPLLEEV